MWWIFNKKKQVKFIQSKLKILEYPFLSRKIINMDNDRSLHDTFNFISKNLNLQRYLSTKLHRIFLEDLYGRWSQDSMPQLPGSDVVERSNALAKFQDGDRGVTGDRKRDPRNALATEPGPVGGTESNRITGEAGINAKS